MPVMERRKFELRWSRRALANAADIFDYVSNDNPDAARDLAIEIRSKAEMLRSHPFLGREIVPGTRELVVRRRYLLSYRIKP